MASGSSADGRQSSGWKSLELEKITINIGAIDLGKIDLLVEEGFYGNRTDFIRTAIRNQLDRHGSDTANTITRKAIGTGTFEFDRSDLERLLAARAKVAISAVGLVSIGHDVSPELARNTIESITVRGVFRASKAVKDALADRIH
jgi:Arc/MetJ-type ribon-helix-helix transcriptional regulator